MKDNRKSIISILLLLCLILIPSSTYIGYKYGFKKGYQEHVRKIKLKKGKKGREGIREGIKGPVKKKKVKFKESKKEGHIKKEKKKLTCEVAKKDFLGFISYLEKKDYIRQYCKKRDLKEIFSDIILRLSSNPPSVQEDAVSKNLIKNIYHFFRILSSDELKLIKEIIRNENDQLEYICRCYYTWLVSQDRCPDTYGFLPTLDTAYKYAVFFLNTIGGRSYLFRRSNKIRLIATYYSLLIIDQMKKRGRNIYGINIYPIAERLKDEIKRYPDLLFQKKYIEELDLIIGGRNG